MFPVAKQQNILIDQVELQTCFFIGDTNQRREKTQVKYDSAEFFFATFGFLKCGNPTNKISVASVWCYWSLRSLEDTLIHQKWQNVKVIWRVFTTGSIQGYFLL
jgi:hypothetical protein